MRWLTSLLKEVRRCAIVIQRFVKSYCIRKFKIRDLNENFYIEQEQKFGNYLRTEYETLGLKVPKNLFDSDDDDSSDLDGGVSVFYGKKSSKRKKRRKHDHEEMEREDISLDQKK